MIYLLLFGLQIIILWRLSSRLTSILLKLMPFPLFVILFLPGTLLHELSHYLMANILFVPVGKFSITPKIYGNEVVLGSVSIAKRDIFRRVLIGAAPIFVGLAIMLGTIFTSLNYELIYDWKVGIVIAYIVFVIGNTMFSSKKDLEGAWRIGVLIMAILITLFATGIRVSFYPDYQAVQKAIQVFKLVNLYLSGPIIIDVAILLLINKYNILKYKPEFN